MSNQTQNQNEIDISPMIKDINNVLKGHLTNLLGPIISEKNAIQGVLLNMPYVRKLKAENEVLKVRNIQLKAELEATKKYYDQELENATKKNVKLEVRDSISSSNETPSKIVELKNQMWRKNEKVNSQEEDDDDDDDDGGLYGEEDDDDEDEDQEYENPIITNLKMSLNKSESVVEITSNGTIETSEEETDNTIKNVTVWDLNKKEENPENNEEEEEDDDEEEEEDDEEEEEDDEEEEEDDEEDHVEEEDDEEDDEEQKDHEEEEVDEEEEEEADEEEEEDDEEGLDVEDVEIDGVLYLTTSTENGEIYKCDEDGEIVEDENGDFVICGYFKNGIANFI